MTGFYLGIDAGGTMTKVAAFDTSGAQVAVALSPNSMILPKPGWTERDAEGMWFAACEGIQKVLQHPKISPDSILGIAPTGFGGGAFFVDQNGKPTRNAVVSTDSRVASLISEWDTTGSGLAIRQEIKQSNWGGQTLAIVAWLKRYEPETADTTHYVMSCKDFLRLRLCNDISTDETDAACSGFYDLVERKLSNAAFAHAGVPEWLEKIPPVGSSTEVVGGITADVAEKTGLIEGTPVVRGVYDVVGCALATGVTRTDQMGAVAGTFAIHSTLHTSPCVDPQPTIQTPYPIDKMLIATMATPSSASNLEWLKNTMLGELEKKAQDSGRSIYDLANEMVGANLSTPNSLIFFPFIYGGPGGMPAGFYGLNPSIGIAEILRAVYEGVVFSHRTDMEHLLGGPQSAMPSVVRLAGGAARSDVWAQMFSDGLGLPIEIADGDELGGKGAAICTAVALGHQTSTNEAIKNMVTINRHFVPNPKRASELSEKFAIYKQAVEICQTIPLGGIDA